jgi:hypothetical protein
MPRLAAAVTAATAAVVALAAGASAPAAAHSGVALTVHDDGRGNVSVDVLWLDGHPVSGTIAGTLSATSDTGTGVGPAPLTRLPGRATVVHDRPLAAGRWRVIVDVAVPGIGRCEATVTVAAAEAPATPGSTSCGVPPSAPSALTTTPAAAPPSGAGRPVWWVVAGLAAVAGPVAVAGLVLLRRSRAAGRVTATAGAPRNRSSDSRRRS